MKSAQPTTFPIHETFQATVQGEGSLAGTPADFIRLYGCPVACKWCDTGYGNGGKDIEHKRVSLPQLCSELVSPLVVVTGGEPFIHQNLDELCSGLLATGRRVSVETSGCKWRAIPEDVWVTLSPKEHLSPNFPVDPRMWLRANEFKFVIQRREDLEAYLPKLSELASCEPVFLQPEWNSRETSLPLTLNLLQEFKTFRLSIQMHKYINVP
jgi:7-carboxy-7-deazaguanine synthase